jgi:hypothetical protein
LTPWEPARLIAFLNVFFERNRRRIAFAAQIQEDSGDRVGEHAPQGAAGDELASELGGDGAGAVKVAGLVVPPQQSVGADDHPHVDARFEAKTATREWVALGAVGVGGYGFAFSVQLLLERINNVHRLGGGHVFGRLVDRL